MSKTRYFFLKKLFGKPLDYNIVEIIGVDNAMVQEMSDEDTVPNDESYTDMKYKRFYKLTPYEKLVGKFSDKDVKINTCIYNYILRKTIRLLLIRCGFITAISVVNGYNLLCNLTQITMNENQVWLMTSVKAA